MPIQPGQTVDVEVMLESKSAGWFSAESDVPFEIEVRSANGGVQVEHGVGLLGSAFLPTLRLVGITLLVMLCMLPILFGADALFNNRTTARVTPIVAGSSNLLLTPTRLPVVSTTVTALTTTPTPVGTPIDANDPDGDGLTNAQERAIGSLPDNPDTDGDGLNDGAEVF